ncbi:response regulator [Hydrogenophaga sp.]|uniref:response regulator n=1 Tax=Hydrogenophaga sp. TaxID=1904254 RepID=UPI002FCC764B
MNALSKPRVLCVDDEPSVLRSLNWLMQDRFDVSSATDACEGLELVCNSDFDVVISDQRMPGMTGTEFLKRVKEASPNTMRLLLTGYSEYADVLRSVNDSEVFRFLNKPWNNQHLIDTVAYAATVAREVPLPRPSNPTSTTEIDMDGLRGRRTEAVLLMDEDPAIEHQLRAILGDEMLLLWARNPSDAIRLLHRHKVAVIVADTRAGYGSTLDLIRAVKRSSPNIVPMIYTTEGDGGNIGRLINEGQIFRFIAKPAGPSYVNRMIRSALQKHRDLMAQPARIARHAVEVSHSRELEHAVDGATGWNPTEGAPRGASFDLVMAARETTSTAPVSGVAWLKRLFGKS